MVIALIPNFSTYRSLDHGVDEELLLQRDLRFGLRLWSVSHRIQMLKITSLGFHLCGGVHEVTWVEAVLKRSERHTRPPPNTIGAKSQLN